jgi:S1-C subfamily serine protease
MPVSVRVPINAVDLAALAAVAIFAVLGFRSGALRQLLAVAGAGAGIVLVLALAPSARDWLLDVDPSLRAQLLLLALAAAVLVGESAGSSVGWSLRRRLGLGVLGGLDAAAGALVGAAQGLVLVWLVGGLLATDAPRALSAQAQRSLVVRALGQILPPPATVAHDVARLLDESGAPNPFVALEPPAAPPVAPPTEASVRAIATRAAPSTVEVQAPACGVGSVGTGFVVRTGYVVTNAHVVAGSPRIRVLRDGTALQAAPVLFDPTLDVALLWVPELRARPLVFADATPGRGADGAALGHPRGGPLAVVPAEVSASYTAVGLDLYDRATVTRRIVELRADVEPGDSGGPFVLENGTVGGVVFAASKREPGVGYALSATDVATKVEPAIGRTAQVGTGPCIR